MTMMKKLALAVVLAVLAGMTSAAAQTYPSRPVTFVVPLPAGGAIDALARIMADRMRTSLGQPVLVENVSGAGGSIGPGRVARAAPDGYTLGLGTWGQFVVNGAVFALPYDLLKDFAPVVLLPDVPYWLIARKTLPAADLKELIAWLKANPDKATAGTVGAGSGSHICGVYLQKVTDTRIQSVPYRGGAPALQDLVSGQIDLMCDLAANSLAQYRAGNLKAYAVTAKTRWFGAPDVPTTDEAGMPGVYLSTWQGIWAPSATPKDVIARINAAAVDAMADSDVRKRIADLGMSIPPRDQQTPEALGVFQKAEIEKWWPIIKGAGIKAE
jgi:tripartite-type tricarboxylate transporter receptor subunit TctC